MKERDRRAVPAVASVVPKLALRKAMNTRIMTMKTTPTRTSSSFRIAKSTSRIDLVRDFLSLLISFTTNSASSRLTSPFPSYPSTHTHQGRVPYQTITSPHSLPRDSPILPRNHVYATPVPPLPQNYTTTVSRDWYTSLSSPMPRQQCYTAY